MAAIEAPGIITDLSKYNYACFLIIPDGSWNGVTDAKRAWCKEQIGPRGDNWNVDVLFSINSEDTVIRFHFVNEADVLLFMLRWGATMYEFQSTVGR